MSEMSKEVKQTIIKISRKLYQRGLVVATDGNVSVRTSEGLHITGVGTVLGEISEESIATLNERGECVETKSTTPSSELEMHLEIYRQRDDVKAIIHAHPPYCTAFSLSKEAALDCRLTEIEATLGEIPIAPPAQPGTAAVARSIRTLIRTHDAIILSNHGALTVGKSLEEAFGNMERLEHYARICYLAKTLDRGK